MTLQQAVDNVPKDGYIVVKQDGKATVRNIITFTVKEETGVGLYLCRPWLQDDEGGK